MTQTVTLPLWLVILGALLAAWASLSLLLFPGVRWFFRRRTNQLIETLNRKLALELPPIALTKREVIVDRLTYDPAVMQAVAEVCEREQAPRAVAMAKVERYAREIAPAFNAFIYFRVGSWLSKRLLKLVYRVRLGYVDREHLFSIDPASSSIVFVMNHRSNMDYVLVTYLALRSVALSYAVGEWARVWPIQQLIRALGAYFVRRQSGSPLYRRVLERYVQMAVEGGATQAVFPEGGLSRDGRLREPRIGLLDYMLRRFDRDGARDIVFIPVGINYDRVLEDRTLLSELDPKAERKAGASAVRSAAKFMINNLWLKLRRRWYSFGYACANFGAPISLRAYLDEHGWDPRGLDKAARGARVEELTRNLMAAVGQLIPVLPVSAVAHVFISNPRAAYTIEALKLEVLSLLGELEKLGAHVYIPREDQEYATDVGLRMLTLRRLVEEEDGQYRACPAELSVLRYYANSIACLTEKLA